MSEEQSDTDNWQARLEDLQKRWTELFAAVAEPGRGAGQLDPLYELAQVGWSAFGIEGDRAREPADRLRAALEDLRERFQARTTAVEPLLAFCRQLLSLHRDAVPLLTETSAPVGPPWPRLGPFQAQQALVERLDEAAARYRRALTGYGERLAAIGENALDSLERRLGGREEPPAARVLLDLWAECVEESHEAELEREEYGEAFAELVNAWAGLTLAWREIADEYLGLLGLPTARALDATQRHLDALRRQHRREVADLRRELRGLRSELEALRQDGRGRGAGRR